MAREHGPRSQQQSGDAGQGQGHQGGGQQQPAPQGRSGGSGGGAGGGESPARDLRGGPAGRWITRKQASVGLIVGLALISLAILSVSWGGGEKKVGAAPQVGHSCPAVRSETIALGSLPVGPDGPGDWFQFPGECFRVCIPPGSIVAVHFEGMENPLAVDGRLPDLEFTEAVPRFRVSGSGTVTIKSWPPCRRCHK